MTDRKGQAYEVMQCSGCQYNVIHQDGYVLTSDKKSNKSKNALIEQQWEGQIYIRSNLKRLTYIMFHILLCIYKINVLENIVPEVPPKLHLQFSPYFCDTVTSLYHTMHTLWLTWHICNLANTEKIFFLKVSLCCRNAVFVCLSL